MKSTRSHLRLTTTGLGLAVVLTLAGCSVADQTGSPHTDSTSSQENTDDGAQPGGTVTFMTHDSFGISEEQISQFEEETGYTLRTTSPGDAGAVANQLILSADNPTVDGVYGIDNYSTHPLVEAEVMAEYVSPALPESAKELLVEGAGQNHFTPIDQGQVCINVDLDWFQDSDLDVPESLADLAEPEYSELLVVTDPTTSSPGQALLVATATEFGEEEDGAGGWQEYWAQLLDNGTKVASGWSDAYYSDFSGSEGQGDYPLVLSYASSPAAEGGVTGVLEATCTPQIEYAGVVDGAHNPEGAQAFIDFMLGQDFQTGLPEAMYMYPVDDSIQLPSDWADHARLATDPIHPNTSDVAHNRNRWLEDWNTLLESAR